MGCAVAGKLTRGMDCAFSLSDKVISLDFQQSIEFLEPSLEPEKGAAICMPSGDWRRIKTALEQACASLKKRCTKDMKESIETANLMIKRLENISINKRSLQ